MRIDQIQKPCTFYYEDEQGNNVPFELTDGFPKRKWYAQHSKHTIVQHSINFAGRKEDAWPIRVLKWVIQKCPNKWKREGSISMNCTVNCGYPVIKYLVEKRGFRFDEACVAYSELCGRCSNIIEDEVNGIMRANYNDKTHCRCCKVIDPEHNYRYITWRLYRALNQKQNFKEVWEDLKDDLLDGQHELLQS